MTGFLTPGQIALAVSTGRERFLLDSNPASGQPLPLTESIDMYTLASVMNMFLNTLAKTMVSGTIYYTQINIGATYTPTPRGSTISQQSFQLNGINIPIGTGGTDTWYVGLWDSSGTLVAQCATAGVTAGTSNTIQQIPFYGSSGSGSAATPVTVTSGTYYMGLQSNGTTATFKALNSPVWPFATGSQAGSAGTLAAITSPATTYTQNLGPMASLY